MNTKITISMFSSSKGVLGNRLVIIQNLGFTVNYMMPIFLDVSLYFILYSPKPKYYSKFLNECFEIAVKSFVNKVLDLMCFKFP